MSTTTSSLISSSAGNSPFAPVTLNGVSQYSSDLQSILNRAVAIAQIPISTLQNQDSTVLSKESSLGQLQSAVQGLAASLTALGTLATGQALSATSSDDSVVSATDTGATAPGTYTINSITSIASAASENSLTGYAATTPVSSTGNMELAVGSKNYNFSLTTADNNLSGLASRIDSLNAGVTASVLTTSTGVYLSVSANSTGATTLQLIDDPGGTGHANAQWLTDNNQGSDADFFLNGIEVKQPSNTANDVIPGLTFNVLSKSSTPVTLSLASDPSQLAGALQTVVNDYNSLRTELNAQEGPSAGALSGDTSVTQLEQAMNKFAGYTNSGGAIQSLSGLGITFSSNGQASFDPSVVNGFTDAQLSAAFSFLGSAASGFVGATQAFQQFSDPTTGLLKVEATGLNTADQHLQSQITTLTNQLIVMQTNLASQLSSADSLIAELQSQQTELNASLQGLDLVLYGKNTSNS